MNAKPKGKSASSKETANGMMYSDAANEREKGGLDAFRGKGEGY